MSAYPALGMGGLCVIGGSMAFFTKRSLPSLLAGVSAGLLYIWSGTQILDARTQGLQAAFLASALLTLSSLPRVTKGPIPKLLAVSSAIVGFYYGRELY
ncbi:hypothetical protein R3P38DRAFT_2951559 [Favolaschia claudopus]|uniref:Transmembrane protein 14C n=1 Tax=Favolaschia claudopus TaxID=2862362 RepID=A0AAW0BFD6_9AGAR